MEVINHGRPKHGVFAIAQPYSGVSYGKRLREKPEYILKNPNGDEIRCQFLDAWCCEIAEFYYQTALCLLVYGHPPEVVVQQLIRKYPKLNQEPKIEILLLKEL